jgi:hypothetical protein
LDTDGNVEEEEEEEEDDEKEPNVPSSATSFWSEGALASSPSARSSTSAVEEEPAPRPLRKSRFPVAAALGLSEGDAKTRWTLLAGDVHEAPVCGRGAIRSRVNSKH